jgi:pimeloyl-ACP methyl ester carboxylesterase
VSVSSGDNDAIPKLPYTLDEGVEQGLWYWAERNCKIRYQKAGGEKEGPAVLLIHGFGGNCDHWRKNIGPLSKHFRVYSIDLLGYGYSDKPDPKEYGETNALYNFYVWAEQINAFLDDVVHKAPQGEGGSDSDSNTLSRDTVLVCNSVGSVAGLQAIADKKDGGDYKGIMLLNPSLRLLHTTKQPWFAKPFVKLFQDFLRNTPAGEFFFSQVADPKAIKNILKEAYHDPETVSDELVSAVLQPGLQPGAASVFLDFISYSGGELQNKIHLHMILSYPFKFPDLVFFSVCKFSSLLSSLAKGPLPEQLIPKMPVPVELVWGEEDPWEPIKMGREEFGKFDTVRNFVPLPCGHCPMDEAPQLVNPLVESFVRDVTSPPSSS